MTASPFASVPDAIAAIARGEIVVVVDDEDRENEGDLILAAEHATPAALAFLVRHTSGVICVAIVGGAVIPPLTGTVADRTTLSFALIVPALCYAVIVAYGLYARRPRPATQTI